MPCRTFLPLIRKHAALVLVAGVALLDSGDAGAHENHAPLPTKGVTIAGDTIMLSDKAREAIGLTTAKVELADIHRVVTVNARVELPWRAQAMITSLVAGRIDHVLARPGETVAAGQELARVASSELAALQLTLLQAKAELTLARKLLEQRTVLDQQGVIAGKTLLEAQATIAQKSAAWEIARQKLASLGLDQATIEQVQQDGQPLSHVSIVSPISGVITHADVRIGQLISPTDHLYHVVDPSTLWIVGDVMESDVRFLKAGQTVEASFAALPGKKYGGQIDHLHLKMDRQRRGRRTRRSRSPTAASSCRPTGSRSRLHKSRAACAGSGSSPVSRSPPAMCWPRSTASSCGLSNCSCSRPSRSPASPSNRCSGWKNSATRA